MQPALVYLRILLDALQWLRKCDSNRSSTTATGLLTKANRPASNATRPMTDATGAATEVARPEVEGSRPATEETRAATEDTTLASEATRLATKTSKPPDIFDIERVSRLQGQARVPRPASSSK